MGLEYTDENRGVIQHDKRARQIVLFDGLRWGKITPTDIDGFLDFGNRLMFFIETKFVGVSLPLGQRLALERLCDATYKHRLKSYAFIAEHNAQQGSDIILAEAIVTEVRHHGAWLIPRERCDVKMAVEAYLRKHGLDKYLESST